MTAPVFFPRFRAFTTTGAPLAAGKVFFYAASTTNPQLTWTDATFSTPNTNPVILDSNGEAWIFPSSLAYRVILQDSAGVVQWDKDNLVFNPALPPGIGAKNVLINGNFSVWQQSTGAGLPNFPTQTQIADGWRVLQLIFAGVSTDITYARTLTGAADVPGGQYCLRIQRTATSTTTGNLSIGQSVESADSMPYLGVQMVTVNDIYQSPFLVLSFWLRFGNNYSGGTFTILHQTGQGTDQTIMNSGFTGPNGNTSLAISTFPTTWTQYVMAIPGDKAAVTSLGVVTGTSTEMGVLFSINGWTGTALTNDYFDISNVQLEYCGIGTFHRGGSNITPLPLPTEFELETFGKTLERCQRRYYKSFPYSQPPQQNGGLAGALTIDQCGGAAAATTSATLLQPWNMRSSVAGTVAVYNPSVANAQVRNTTTAADCTATAVVSSTNEAHITFTTAGGSAAGNVNRVHYTIDKSL